MEQLAKSLIAERFIAHSNEYDEHALAQQQINQQLVQLLAQTDKASFKRVLEIGCGTGDFTQKLLAIYPIEQLVVNDLSAVFRKPLLQKIAKNRPLVSFEFMEGDAEHLVFEGKFDLLSSASAIQWFEHPQAFVRQASDLLQTGGVLLFNSFSSENLTEIRQLTGVGLTYPNQQDWQAWLGNDFTKLHIHQQQIRLAFPSPLAVLQHLRQTGVTATSRNIWTRKMLSEFNQQYLARFSCEQGVYLTYTPIFILGVRK
ncbi:malonyl-ACP O-methyltransferase BioC [Actinobacillus vicugnae]|uniref:malonyl-ACP O-methyltransferase BioC n=1 Tax=Actinobacillus vicugnae TaxID=2573093 RepID=UPI00124157FA|nr:malonyl-ACP O-methyltransferase BioC [Actinobacillus vicugnae]